MNRMRLTPFVLALKNLRKRSFRTKYLIVTTALLAFIIFCGALLSQSLNLGKNYMSGRMGSDLMVVPRGDGLKLQNTLLRSQSNTFFMKENLENKISKIDGVLKISPQLFIGSLNASCCTVPVQLIGFDPSTDFTIKSWMTKIDTSKLGLGEVIVGSRVNTAVGSDLWLFGQPLKVIATLDDTGMGFDSSVFMTIDTTKLMIETSGETAIHPAGSGKEQASALFIKLVGGYGSSQVAKSILTDYPETDVVVLSEMMQDISTQITNIKGLIYGIQVLLWAVSIFILTVIYTFTFNEREREFGLLLSLGATRNKLLGIIMSETFIVSIIGAPCGVLAAGFLMYEFRMLIAVSIGIPYMQPTIGLAISLGAVSIIISVMTGMVTCIYSAKRIGRMETYTLIREYE